MRKDVNFDDFLYSFSDTYRENFSYNGKRALFDYLEELEESTGEEITLDTIALCCEYSEYNSALEATKEYDAKIEKNNEKEALSWLEEKTQVIPVEGGGVIIYQF